MEKKIPVKTLYLLLVIGIGLVGLGLGSTYAIFTANAEISDPISLKSNLSYTESVIETVEVEVPSGEKITSTINVTNDSGSTLNYVVWYLDEGKNIMVIADNGSTGSLNDTGNISINIDIFNNEENLVNVVLGVSSSVETVVLGENMKYITQGELFSSSEVSYDNTNTGVNCSDVTCMLDYLYDLVG